MTRVMLVFRRIVAMSVELVYVLVQESESIAGITEYQNRWRMSMFIALGVVDLLIVAEKSTPGDFRHRPLLPDLEAQAVDLLRAHLRIPTFAKGVCSQYRDVQS